MTSALETIRYHSGIAGEEVADMVDSLEREVSSLREQVEKLTKERDEVIRLAREVADASLNDPVVGSSIVLDIGEMKRLIKLVKAEENEAIIAAANALENIASTSSSTRIRRVANDALTAIRARRKACCEKS